VNKINYQRELDQLIEEIEAEGKVPTLLLHSCCAPCSSYCIEYLSQFFAITVFYYNPNIYPDEEYFHRVKEQQRFISEFPTRHPVSFIEGDFEKDRFYSEVAKGLEKEPERGARCTKCFELRLGETAKRAAAEGMDYFATTLTISPMKDVELLNSIGAAMGERYGVEYLATEFRKKNGYLRSTQISKEYDMYRQDYCGCVYSKVERESQGK
jgi:predicted adenine nucleotide alpha hydrolase (AANH) superfamily ATPase